VWFILSIFRLIVNQLMRLLPASVIWLIRQNPVPGTRKTGNPGAVNKIHQLHGDSAVFDFSPYAKSCSLVFVDGSHCYETVKSDSYAAMEMVEPGGTVLWHDYGIWEGVTNVLDEMAFHDGMSILNISGTSLAYWQNDTL
jgi:hypothetical protein